MIIQCDPRMTDKELEYIIGLPEEEKEALLENLKKYSSDGRVGSVVFHKDGTASIWTQGVKSWYSTPDKCGMTKKPKIDKPLVHLIGKINRTTWARTWGCCAGRALHNHDGFYIVLAVKGMKGIKNFFRWMSLAHAIGYEAAHNKTSFKSYAITRAEAMPDNLLRSDKSVLNGNKEGWFFFRLFSVRMLSASYYKTEMSTQECRTFTKADIVGQIKSLMLGLEETEKE